LDQASGLCDGAQVQAVIHSRATSPFDPKSIVIDMFSVKKESFGTTNYDLWRADSSSVRDAEVGGT
jgi:hypothetical protein